MRLMLMMLLTLFLSGCLVGPHYKEPKKKVAAHWIKHDRTVKETPNHDTRWWTLFHDPTLTALIQRGYHNNITLQIAGVQVLQARAQLAQAVGELYPQQQEILGNLTYQRLGGTSLESVLPSNFWTNLLGLSASWEIDFWGKYRRAILANDANFLASYAAYDHALVSLTANIALTYISIRTTQEMMKIIQENIRVQMMGLSIAKVRYQAGQVSLFDVEQAQAELSQTQARLPELLSQLQIQKDMLAVLLGTTPDCIDGLLGKNHGIPHSPSTVAVDIPRKTIFKRPDVYQARLKALAQSEMIGAIKANLYPAFSLTGTFAFAANTINQNSLSDIFNWNNRTVTAGPSFVWPILNYGQITNAVRQQDAMFQQTVLRYVNLVLKAQQEVQDSITAFIEAKRATKYLVMATNAASKSLQLALIRYREGESDYTPVLDAERQLLSTQTKLTQAQGRIPKALIMLYRALGGAWKIRKCNDIVATEIRQEMAARTDWGSLLKQPQHQPPTTKKQQWQQLYLPDW